MNLFNQRRRSSDSAVLCGLSSVSVKVVVYLHKANSIEIIPVLHISMEPAPGS